MTDLAHLSALIANEIPVAPTNRSYWIFRTEGGSYYDFFIQHGLICFGYNDISAGNINSNNKSKPDDAEYKKWILGAVKDAFPLASKRQLSVASNNIFKFSRLMKKGDLVLIPGSSSKRIMIGEITSDTIMDQKFRDKEDKILCKHSKYKSVKWVQEVRRWDLTNKLYGTLFSHQTIIDINSYGNDVEPLINDVYSKDGRFHIRIHVKNKRGIKARELSDLLSGILNAEEVTAQEKDIQQEELDDIEIKTDIQSPGFLELCTGFLLVAGGLFIISLALTGGKFNLKTKLPLLMGGVGLSGGTPGLITALSKFLKENPKIVTALIEAWKKKGGVNIGRINELEKLGDPDFRAEYDKLPRRLKRPDLVDDGTRDEDEPV